jgi:hypothetical protein
MTSPESLFIKKAIGVEAVGVEVVVVAPVIS